MNLQEALADFKQRALNAEDHTDIDVTSRWLDYYYGKASENNLGKFTRLRLDWELSLKTLVDYEDISEVEEIPETDERVLDLMMLQAKADLDDLIKNGDTSKTSDALLKAMDGEVKRGKPVSHVEIVAGNLYRQYISRKESLEYTLYMVLYTEFE